jgi:hypothetical protein
MRLLTTLALLVIAQPLHAQTAKDYEVIDRNNEIARLIREGKPYSHLLPALSPELQNQAIAKSNTTTPETRKVEPALTRTEPDVLSRRAVFAQPSRTASDADLVAVLLRIEHRLSDMEARQHDYETRLSALERGAISAKALRAPAVLTDPGAAAAAGRTVGGYDQFGRFVGFASQAAPAAPVATSVTLPQPAFQTFAAPIATPPVQLVPAFAPSSFSYSASVKASSGGCSGGSCGSGRGLLGRLAARRGR